jgi:hypothetical protein
MTIPQGRNLRWSIETSVIPIVFAVAEEFWGLMP